MPAAMTAIPRCSSAPRATSPLSATATAWSGSSSSRPRRTTTAPSAMIADGLFERFPVVRVFGLHNFPGLPDRLRHAGRCHLRGGRPARGRAAGRAAHAAIPHVGDRSSAASADRHRPPERGVAPPRPARSRRDLRHRDPRRRHLEPDPRRGHHPRLHALVRAGDPGPAREPMQTMVTASARLTAPPPTSATCAATRRR